MLQVAWYKDGGVVVNREGLSLTSNNNKYTLQITNMNEKDFGRYTCHATNKYGESMRIIVLSGTVLKWKRFPFLSSFGHTRVLHKFKTLYVGIKKSSPNDLWVPLPLSGQSLRLRVL